ncbi:KOW domain-containing RNA-binding protein [Macrococcus armenti]|uniref:KOW domain-containing RNA-binding protein n=1 Tax=Macrococcus armenti TaxID=2875764 RepID=UPI001CC95BA1|nr:KOW domain-containing RNA-binding protein [Macrococcus armenti]UBH22586.1 KOW domain-containing RNA-binding protein [Macrococcus armenti]
MNQASIGQFVTISRGKDKGLHGVIISIIDQRFVLVTDGDKRKMKHPKKKNLSHLILSDVISPEIKSSISEAGFVTDAKLRYVLQKYTARISES